jgi:hypothetical protein
MTVAQAVEALDTPRRPASPYVGLVPYSEEDAAFFFGRSREAAIVAANLQASRLTVLYGPSGVGKSSLLMAGVVHALRTQARPDDAEHSFAICVVRAWHDDPLRTVRKAARAALQEAAGSIVLEPERATLAESLAGWTAQAGTLLVVLDQFDEYLRYHPDEQDGDRLIGFAAELAEVANRPNLAVNVLISIREDAWAKLDCFEGHIPLLFANYLRVDHLDPDAAREAIEGPIGAWNRTLQPGEARYEIEPALIASMLDAAVAGARLPAASDTAEEAAVAGRVEAPFLQLVLERLWRATVSDGERILTLARLQQLGGATTIVENHLLEALRHLGPREQDIASACFRFLVSSERTKVAQSAVDLAEWTRQPEAEVDAVLARLCAAESGRILRAVAPAADTDGAVSYELFHDVLAESILTWRRAHERERSRRAFRRRLARFGAVSLALITVFAGLGIWALIERGHAQSRAHDLQAFNGTLHATNTRLEQQKNALAKELKAKQQQASTTLRRLRAANRSLRREVADLQARRNTLARKIASLVAGNRRLATGIAGLNTENRRLAATIDRLNRADNRLQTRLFFLDQKQWTLASDASVLKAESADLAAQLRDIRSQNVRLRMTARELGFAPTLVFSTPATSGPLTTHHKPAVAAQFGIPAELPAYDTLRKKVAALQLKLANLQARQARQKQLRKENGLLRRQRTALRKETTQLKNTRARLQTRENELATTLAAAEAEHTRLRAQARAAETMFRTRARAVAVKQKAISALQSRDNSQVEQIGYLQMQITLSRSVNAQLVNYLRGATKNLVQAAEALSQDPTLAGLLAVEATRVTPDNPDDAAYPSVYNALWLALSRLDAQAASELIAPVASSTGKIGTTRSKLLKQKICALVPRGLTKGEWKRYLPARAPYPSTLAHPCA